MVGQKNSTKPNPIHMDRGGPGWTHGLDHFIIIIIIIIIKLSRKNYKYKYIKKTQRLGSM